MSIFKVAKMFQNKLVLASNGNFQSLKSIYDAAIALTSPNIKNLWLTSENSVNDPYETNVGDILDNIRSVASRAYGQVMEQGMPASGQWGYAGFLQNMDNALQQLTAWHPSKPLDPMASDKMTALRQAVEGARSTFTPVGIPAQKPKETVMQMPQDTLTAKPPQSQEGAALQGEPAGDDSEKLKGVVDSLVDKPKPQWSGFFEPTE